MSDERKINPRDFKGPKAASKKKTSRPNGSKPKRKPASGGGGGVRRWLLRAAIFSTIWVAIIGFIGTLYVLYDLPDLSGIETIEKKPSIIVKAADGEIVATYGDVYGEFLKYKDLPEDLVQSVLATEDRRFFYHFGVDVIGILRAMWVNYQEGRVVQGGSTITQQLAKNVFLRPERTLYRKIQEAFLALRLEANFTKEQILAIYLNRVYLGAGSFGVDAASKRYFGKPARELTLAESAMLVGLLKAPSSYSPTSNPDLAGKRTGQVIQNLVEIGYITEAKAEQEMLHVMAGLEINQIPLGSYYYGDWIVEQLGQLIGPTNEDVVVETTMDRKLQQATEERLAAALNSQGRKFNVSQASAVVMRTDGAVLSIVGGRSYRESQYNRVTQALRQPGSAFKMLVYLAAVEQGYNPEGLFEDQPVSFGRWSPSNYDGEFSGPVTMKEALTRSINTVAAQIAYQVTPSAIIETARRLGITGNMVNNLTLSLGTSEVTLMELTQAFAHLANDGRKTQAYGITRVTAKSRVVYERKPVTAETVITPDHVAMMNDMLASVVESGTGRRAALDRTTAGKTGTTQDFKDAWFVGYTADAVAGVWMGNDDNKSMKKVTGGALPAGLWKEIMQVAHAGIPPHDLPRFYTPSEVISHEGESGETPENGQGGRENGNDSFWDKLLGNEQAPSVEHEYPEPVRN